MEIKIDEQKILTEILERDGSIHEKIKQKVQDRVDGDIESELFSEFIDSGWHGQKDEIRQRVLDDIAEKQTEMVKKILKEFYNNYRYKKTDLAVLKELKKFLDED